MNRRTIQIIISIITAISIMTGIFLTIISSTRQQVKAVDDVYGRCTCEKPMKYWGSLTLESGLPGHVEMCMTCGKQCGKLEYCSDSRDRNICDICGVPFSSLEITECNHNNTIWVREINKERLGHRKQCIECNKFTIPWEACKDTDGDHKCDKCEEILTNFEGRDCLHGNEIWHQKKAVKVGGRFRTCT